MPPKGTGRTGRRGRGTQSSRGGSGRGRGQARPGGATSLAHEAQDGAASEIDAAQSNLASDAATSLSAPSAVQESTEHKPSPSAVGTPALTPQPTPLPATRGTTARGNKFRPKGIRRSEAERERIIQEQDAILNQRLADDAKQRARANRLRAGRGRGRGRGRGGPISTMAAGPLAQGFGFDSTSGGYGMATSYREGSGARRSGAAGPGGKFKGDPSDPRYGVLNDDDFDRINADLLYSRFELDAGNAAGSHMIPMGIPRIEHREEKVVMATAAEIEAREHGEDMEGGSDEDMWVDDPTKYKAEPVKDEQVWEHAAPKPAGPVKVKRPDGSVIETMDIDEIATGEVLHEDEKKPDVGSNDRKARKRVIPKDPEEEYLADVLQRNLRVFSPPDEETQAKGEPHPREGKVFLFQLPPILPPLGVKKREPATNPVKDEPSDEVVMLDLPQGDPTSVDLTKDEDKEVKQEKGKVEDKATRLHNKQLAGREWPKTGGYLGKLNLHKSGKITLDWGGLPMAVEAAIPVSFIRTAVLVNQDDTKQNTDDPGQFDGTAYGMGRIDEKFCCAPIFTPPEPWVIDPKDLEPPTEE